ncbi:MAG: flippase [Candidatus Parvarchaeota archaeon]|nr:flippase [Candidatus Jingweiarchaeum tengchongense]MCW1298347.1 flippase [Candidatus Jingweiarchaeum tengchongense]MCW1310758.1 flippase [Candidatus Jingweiarchaeum tengchongense]
MENETVKMVAKNAAFRFLGMIISTVLAFFSSILVARMLGKHYYGILSIALLVLSTILTFSDFGVTQTTAYFIPKLKKDKGRLKYFLNKMLFIKLLIAVFFAFIIFIFSGQIANFFKIDELDCVLKIFSFVFIPYVIFNYFYSIFQGFENIKYCMYQDIIHSIAKFIPLILLVITLDKLIGVSVGYIWLYALASIFSILFYSKIYPWKVKERRIDDKQIKSYAFFTFTFIVLSFITSNSIGLFIGYFRDPSEVSYFTISQVLANAIAFVPSALSYAFFPSVSRLLTEKKKKELHITLNEIVKYCIIFAIPASVAMFILSRSIIIFVYGNEFSLADNTLKVMTIVFLIYSSTLWLYPLFGGYGKMKLLSKIKLYLAIITIISSLIFVPIMGAVGAALVMLISEVIFSILGYFKLVRIEKLKVKYGVSVKALLSSILILPILLTIHYYLFGIIELLAAAFICTPTYLIILYLLGGINKNDIKLLSSTLGIPKLKSFLHID